MFNNTTNTKETQKQTKTRQVKILQKTSSKMNMKTR